MSEQLTREQQARQEGFDICQAFLETLDALYPARARDATNPDRGTGLVGDRPVNVHDAMTRAWSLQAGFHNGTNAAWDQIQNQLSVLRRELWAGAQTSYNGPGRLCQVLSGHRRSFIRMCGTGIKTWWYGLTDHQRNLFSHLGRTESVVLNPDVPDDLKPLPIDIGWYGIFHYQKVIKHINNVTIWYKERFAKDCSFQILQALQQTLELVPDDTPQKPQAIRYVQNNFHALNEGMTTEAADQFLHDLRQTLSTVLDDHGHETTGAIHAILPPSLRVKLIQVCGEDLVEWWRQTRRREEYSESGLSRHYIGDHQYVPNVGWFGLFYYLKFFRNVDDVAAWYRRKISRRSSHGAGSSQHSRTQARSATDPAGGVQTGRIGRTHPPRRSTGGSTRGRPTYLNSMTVSSPIDLTQPDHENSLGHAPSPRAAGQQGASISGYLRRRYGRNTAFPATSRVD